MNSFSLHGFSNSIESINKDKPLPPIHLWNPPFCGDIPIIIKSDGHWLYNGTAIRRINMVKLFASVLRKENDGQYYLVTPYEKVRIQVENVPFIMVSMTTSTENNQSNIILMTQLGDKVSVCDDHPLEMKNYENKNIVPYIKVRSNLYGRVNRNLYYQLINLAEIHDIGNSKQLGIFSRGSFFSMGDI